MNLVLVQRFICATVTVILLLNTVFAKQTNFIATSTKQTSLQYMFHYMNSNENNTIVITSHTLVAFYVWTSNTINETLCKNGGIRVYSRGFPGAGYYVGTFCGGLKGETFVGSHNSMVIILDNVALSPEDRLSITYYTQQDCGEGATASRSPRYIRSPGYPNGGISAKFSTCAWLPHANSGERVRMTLKYAQESYAIDCHRSNVTIMDGANLRWYKRTIGRWCGGPQSRYISWENMAGILAKGLEYLQSGFEIEFVAVPGDKCEHTLSATSGVITSPGYPSGYTDLLECRWKIQASGKKNIIVTVLDSDMDSSLNCTRDSVKIYQNSQALDGEIEQWCGTDKPSYEFYNSVVLLVFKAGSDYNHPHRGIKFRYEISVVEDCGRYELSIYPNKTRSVWHSPGYPGNYFDNMHCRLVFASFTRIRLEIQVKDIRKIDRTCGGDFIRVYDGHDNRSKFLRKICYGYTVVESTGSKLFVEFITDDRDRGSGFDIYYQAIGEKIVTEAPSGNSGSKSKSKGGSFNPWILVGGLIPTIVVVVIIVGIIIYVKCRYSSGSSQSTRNRYMANNSPPVPEYLPDDSNREELQSINRRAPSAPPPYNNQRTDPYAPPPSYFEIDQFPKEVKNDDDPSVLPPPPSYTDAIGGGMMIQNDSHRTGDSPDTAFSFV